jgi:hypothetical protein
MDFFMMFLLSFGFHEGGETGRAIEPPGSSKIVFVHGGSAFAEAVERNNLWN